MRVKCFFAVVFLCILFSCDNTELVFTQGDISIAQPEVFDIRANPNPWIRNNLELDRIVQIETTEKYVMGDYFARVILYKDKLIILDKDTHTIFIINAYTGKVEAHINRKGRGPGESRFIVDIAFDDKNEQILAYNDYSKLVYFGLNGEFLKEERVNNELYDQVIYDNDNLIFSGHGFGTNIYPYSIDIYNLTSKTWKTIGTKQKVNFNYRFYTPVMVKSKNIWYAPVLDTGLHLLDSISIKVPYSLDVKNPLTKELLDRYKNDRSFFDKEVDERDILFLIQNIKETENFLVFTTNLGLMMMDKNTLEIQSTRWIEDEYLGIKLNHFKYIAHNGDDNRIMVIVDCEAWLNRKPTAQNTPEHLKAQIDAVKVDEKIESNPILVFYKEK